MRRARRRLARGVLGALLAHAIAASAGSAPEASEPDPTTGAPPDLESLLAEFAAMPGFSARFMEEKRLALLREPLVTRGVVYFARPRRLVRHAEEPVASTLLVQGQEIAFGSTAGTRTIDLAASPALRSLVDGIRLVLAGDLDALRERFRIELLAPDDVAPVWKIRLAPLHPPLRELIESISIEGRGHIPRELRVVERSGDETVTLFSEVETDRHFSEDELATLFRVPAR